MLIFARYYWILGGGICMIVIIFCLFPLWPKKIRKGAGWLSWIAVLFLLAVLVVGIIKYLLFSVLYILSARKLRLVAKKITYFPGKLLATSFITGSGSCQI